MLPQQFISCRFILASKSPRRQSLLRALGISFELQTMEVDETFPDHLKADAIPLFLCRKKAGAFQGQLDEKTIVIAADTIVWINGHVLNKPADAEEARVMLIELSGNRHEVFTGVCLKSATKEVAFSVRTDVYFNNLKDKEIDWYISTYKPFDKAGAYGAQEFLPAGTDPCSPEEKIFLQQIGRPELGIKTLETGTATGFAGVKRIEGSYFNVMGLPIREMYGMLTRFCR
ncbi:MAG TPA: Maf family nucleotide pyrophosphatase [Bacteroidia bacterium]|nr:Maf family nucleotide pyrophosphatase [Bacteroidia bacterium]